MHARSRSRSRHAQSTLPVARPHKHPHTQTEGKYWKDVEWMVVVGSFLAFMVAWGIGANDVANAFATSE